jgi:hypothetical protein
MPHRASADKEPRRSHPGLGFFILGAMLIGSLSRLEIHSICRLSFWRQKTLHHHPGIENTCACPTSPAAPFSQPQHRWPCRSPCRARCGRKAPCSTATSPSSAPARPAFRRRMNCGHRTGASSSLRRAAASAGASSPTRALARPSTPAPSTFTGRSAIRGATSPRRLASPPLTATPSPRPRGSMTMARSRPAAADAPIFAPSRNFWIRM